MHDQLIDLLLTGTIDTLIMVGASAFFALLIGLPMAVVLVSTSEHGIYPSKSINHSLGWLVKCFMLHFLNGFFKKNQLFIMNK